MENLKHSIVQTQNLRRQLRKTGKKIFELHDSTHSHPVNSTIRLENHDHILTGWIQFKMTIICLDKRSILERWDSKTTDNRPKCCVKRGNAVILHFFAFGWHSCLTKTMGSLLSTSLFNLLLLINILKSLDLQVIRNPSIWKFSIKKKKSHHQSQATHTNTL